VNHKLCMEVCLEVCELCHQMLRLGLNPAGISFAAGNVHCSSVEKFFSLLLHLLSQKHAILSALLSNEMDEKISIFYIER
jgi:hypothetical protein